MRCDNCGEDMPRKEYDNLQGLCSSCHRRITKKQREEGIIQNWRRENERI